MLCEPGLPVIKMSRYYLGNNIVMSVKIPENNISQTNTVSS